MQETISVECPHCGEKFVVVEPESGQNEDVEEQEPELEHPMTAELVSWEEVDVTDPYSGNDEEMPVEQRVKADIGIDGQEYPFTFWYLPEYDYFSYVVRGQVDTGMKSKDAYLVDRDRLTFTNRGMPRDSDKQWTYLDEEECRRRSDIAGLGEVVDDPEQIDKDNRFRIHLNEQEIPLVEDGEIAEVLVLKLAKGLVVFQTAY